MRILTTAVVAAALLASGCAKKKIAELPPADVTSGSGGTAGADGATGLGADGSVAGGAVAGSQADLVARAGSDTIYFNTDKYELDDASRATLDAQAAWLAANGAVRVTIEGHADERGTREYNLALGDRRATAARNHLAAKGVASDRMTVVSWGKERPVAAGSDEQSWAQNRRSVTVTAQ
jgi:peptidoglycan-associated lipoprotein